MNEEEHTKMINIGFTPELHSKVKAEAQEMSAQKIEKPVPGSKAARQLYKTLVDGNKNKFEQLKKRKK